MASPKMRTAEHQRPRFGPSFAAMTGSNTPRKWFSSNRGAQHDRREGKAEECPPLSLRKQRDPARDCFPAGSLQNQLLQPARSG